MSFWRNVRETTVRVMGRKEARAERQSYDEWLKGSEDQEHAQAQMDAMHEDEAYELDEDEAYARNYAMSQREAEADRASMYDDPSERYLDFRDREEWGEERGNPPDSMLRDLTIEQEAGRFPQTKPEPTKVDRGADRSWTFEEWAQAHGYDELKISRANEIEDWRAGIRERDEKAEGEYFAGVFGQAQQREPADLERGQLHGPAMG